MSSLLFASNFFGFVFPVTTVDSGTRALQYLGLDGNKGASDLKVIRRIKKHIFLVI